VKSYNVPVNNDEFGLPTTGFVAANGPTYNITGQVLAGGAGTTVDLSYIPLGNTVEITLRTVTGVDGGFAFQNLPVNNYRLRASRTGFVFTPPPNIDLQSDRTINVDAENSCIYTPGNTSSIPIAGGLSQFLVSTSQPTCAWLAASDVPWITINSGAIVGNGPVHFTAQANIGPGRIGSIRIAGRPDPIFVQQATSNPTFAPVTGRVMTPSGQLLRNAVVTLIDIDGVRQTATTSSFGVYTFPTVQTGQIYTSTVNSKRYRFAPRTLQVTGSLVNIDFVGLE